MARIKTLVPNRQNAAANADNTHSKREKDFIDRLKIDPSSKVEEYANSLPVAYFSYENQQILYGVPNPAALWRVNTFETKEPETVKWLKSFKPNDVFVDIGANMGLYTMFAAVFSKARVYAFEPEAQNFALLNRNIEFNNIVDRVTAWCCALSNKVSIDRLYLSTTKVAYSGHSFGAEVGPTLEPRPAAYVQGSIAYTLDELVASKSIPVPNHVKIDVDGIEYLVVQGANQTFANQELKSVLIEISPHLKEHAALLDVMTDFGFGFDPAQVERAQRKEGPTKDYAEYIFKR